MAGDARDRARDLIREAVGLDGASRSTLIDRARADPVLDQAVRSLLSEISVTLSPGATGEVGGAGPATEWPSVSSCETRVSPPPAAQTGGLAPLDQVGPYRIVRALGAGGMGDVFEAFDERLRRRVAIKSVRAGFGAAAKVRFLREARALSSLNHPNICGIYDFVEQGGENLLVLEYIDGRPLSRLVGTFTRARALEIAEQIARVLAAAHGAGIVHRDLKPENVMIGADGAVKVLDFGLARSAAAGAEEGEARASGATWPEFAGLDASVTSPGTILGTPMYMSPEQASGADAITASDMYAFGLVVQELVSGEPPMDRGLQVAEVLRRVRRGESAAARGLGTGLGALVRELKSVQPSERPTAVEAAQRLARLRTAPRRRALWGAAAAVLLLGIAGGVKYAVDLKSEQLKEAKAREDAEGFVSLLVDKSRDKLQAAGRLDVIESIAGEVRAYYARREPGSLDREQLFRFARAVQLLGEAALGAGKLEEARGAFASERDLLSDLVAGHPGEGRFLKALGAAHFYLGDVARRSGDLATAEREWNEYLGVARRLVKSDPSSAEWQLELAYAYSNFVTLSQDRADSAGAFEWLRKTLEVKRGLVALEPSNIEYRRSLANSLTQLANAEDRAGNAGGALAAAGEAVRTLAAEARPDAGGQYRLALGHGHVGELHLKGERYGEALTSFRAMQDVMRRLIELDPSNGDWQREMAVGHRLAARAELGAGDGAGAGLDLAVSRRMLEALIARDPRNLRWRHDLVSTEREASRGASMAKRWDEARDCLRRAHAVLEGGAAPSDSPAAHADLEVRLASLEIAEGKVASAAGDSARAHELWAGAVGRLEPVAVAAGELDVLDMLAQALLLLDRAEEAAPYVARLRAAGGTPSEEVTALLARPPGR